MSSSLPSLPTRVADLFRAEPLVRVVEGSGPPPRTEVVLRSGSEDEVWGGAGGEVEHLQAHAVAACLLSQAYLGQLAAGDAVDGILAGAVKMSVPDGCLTPWGATRAEVVLDVLPWRRPGPPWVWVADSASYLDLRAGETTWAPGLAPRDVQEGGALDERGDRVVLVAPAQGLVLGLWCPYRRGELLRAPVAVLEPSAAVRVVGLGSTGLTPARRP